MEIDYSKIMTYDVFENTYLPVINSDSYNDVLDKAENIAHKLNCKYKRLSSGIQYNPGVKGLCVMTITQKIQFVCQELRNEKNPIIKHLVLTNLLLDDSVIDSVFKIKELDIDNFVSKLNNFISLSKISKSLKMVINNEEISSTLNKISEFVGINNFNLLVLKLYEMKSRKGFQKTKK